MAHGNRIDDSTGSGNAAGGWAVSPGLSRIPGLVHGFTRRAWGDFAQSAARRRLLEASGARSLRLLRQVHGVCVIDASDGSESPEGDAWAGRPEAGVLLGVCTADCLPVLLCHPQTRTVGLAHAGWRGATAGIAAAALKAMGAPADEVIAALGPAIGPCCYEVGEDVAAAAGPDSPHVKAAGRGKFRFDLPGFVRSQLLGAGVPAANVDCVGPCTRCRTDLLYSFRGEGRTGRLCAFMGWKEA